MGIDSKSFWGPDPAKNPPLTDAMVKNAEKKLGVRLPETFIELLHIKNGGGTRGFVCPTKERAYGEDYVPLSAMFGIGASDADGDGYNILSSPEMTGIWELPPRQVLLMGEGHWWLSLDYRRWSGPSISYIDVDEGREVRVADSFDAFVSKLLPRDAVDSSGARLKASPLRRQT